MAEELKKARAIAKSALTRSMNTLRRLVAEEEMEEVKQGINTIKEKFKQFDRCHQDYHVTLKDDEDIKSSDQYFDDQQESYIWIIQ